MTATTSNCPACRAETARTEGIGEGRVRVQCAACGFHEVRDAQGRKHLIAEDPRVGGSRPLMG